MIGEWRDKVLGWLAPYMVIALLIAGFWKVGELIAAPRNP